MFIYIIVFTDSQFPEPSTKAVPASDDMVTRPTEESDSVSTSAVQTSDGASQYGGNEGKKEYNYCLKTNFFT